MKLSHLLPLALLAACAHTPPPELADARTAYDRASKGLAAQLAPADLHIASQQLALAERTWEDRGDTYETRDLAYAAMRKARLAEVKAHTIAARQQQSDAQAELDRLREDQVRTTSAQLSAAQQQLQVQQQQLQSAERARVDAEKRAQQAQADLARIGQVRQEPRGMVITLSGSVLFVSGKSDLLPEAIARLNEVAQVLGRQDKESKITVQGFTDSQGGADYNLDLSRHRAEAVRDFLISHGIASDRVSAEGYGEARPIASNATPEGRANNRRVEIVVTK